MKISSKEKKMLLVLLLGVGAALFYLYVLTPSAESLKKTTADYEVLQSGYTTLSARLKKEEEFDKSIQESTDTIKKFSQIFYEQTFQSEFIRKFNKMCAESNIYFKSTNYSNINSVYSDNGSGSLNIKSFSETFNKSKGEAGKKPSETGKKTTEELDAKFLEFTDSINVTSTSFNFTGTYPEVREFVSIMNKVNKNDRYIIASTFTLQELDGLPDAPGKTRGFTNDSGEIYDATVTIYFYMIDDVTTYLNKATEEIPKTPETQKQ